MINVDDETQEYLAECRERLATVESDLQDMESAGVEIDEGLVNRVFRAVHSAGGAGFFDLAKIGELAQRMEEVLLRIRARKLLPAPELVRVLLSASHRLHEMIQNPGVSDQADIAGIVAELTEARDNPPPAAKRSISGVDGERKGKWRLRALLVEDDFASRLVLQTFLSRYGDCHVAVNGREAVDAFRAAIERGHRYDLICMDIMMPELSGREAVRQIRALEEAQGIFSTSGAKIIMTTAVNDVKEVAHCFRELCDAYLVKPIDLGELLGKMKQYQLAP
jgi:two-component system chemotaxis response regulator CheY